MSLDFDTSLCRFWYSHLLLGDILCASLDQCNIPSLRERNKDKLNLQNLAILRQYVANLSICMAKFGISNDRLQIAMVPI